MLLDILEMKQEKHFLTFLFKSKGNGNHVFSEKCITEELNGVFYTMPIQYINWTVSLDRFMMNADIKLILMGLGYTTFDDLSDRSFVHVLSILEPWVTMLWVWGELQKQA